MRNDGITGAAVAPSFAEPDLPREERTTDLEAWRRQNEEKGRARTESPIAAARRRQAEQAALAAVDDAAAPAEAPAPAPVPKPAPRPRPRPKPVPSRPTTSEKPSVVGDAVLAQASLAGDSVQDIAARYGLSVATVRQRLKALGVPLPDRRRTPREIPDQVEIVRDYLAGATPLSLAKKYHHSKPTILRALTDAGVELRDDRVSNSGGANAVESIDPTLVEKVRDLYVEKGHTLREVAADLGLGLKALVNLMERNGIARRPANHVPAAKREEASATAKTNADEIRKALAAAGTDVRSLRRWAVASGYRLATTGTPARWLVDRYLEARTEQQQLGAAALERAAHPTPTPTVQEATVTAPVPDDVPAAVVTLHPPAEPLRGASVDGEPLEEVLAGSAFGPIATGLVKPQRGVDVVRTPDGAPELDAVDLDKFELIERLAAVAGDLADLGQPFAARAIATRAARLSLRLFVETSPRTAVDEEVER